MNQVAPGRPPDVSLFGGLAVGRTAIRPPAGAPWRIVAWLALYHASTREELADALWPEASASHAGGNVRTGLWRLRTRFPGLVDDATPVVRLADATVVDVRSAITAARAITAADADVDIVEVRRLVDDPRLLPGWYDEWVLEERERFRQLRLHALERAAHRLAARHEFGAATEAALAAVRAEPLRESAHRALIQVHLTEGNVAEARRQYAACARVLEGELGARPSRDLEAMVRGGT